MTETEHQQNQETLKQTSNLNKAGGSLKRVAILDPLYGSHI